MRMSLTLNNDPEGGSRLAVKTTENNLRNDRNSPNSNYYEKYASYYFCKLSLALGN